MAETNWNGTTSDATLDSNWSNGVPDSVVTAGGKDVLITGGTAADLVGFGAVRAKGTLTTTDNFDDGDTVTIDTKVYTFEDILTNVDGNVLVGTDAEDSLDNLELAITLGTGAGTKYAAAMTAHTTCSGFKRTASTFRAYALNAGLAGNSFDSLETGDGVSWGAATFAGGHPEGAIVANVFINEDFPGDINSSGSGAVLVVNGIFHHRGSGTLYLNTDSGFARLIVDSANDALAAEIVNVDSPVSMEFMSGRVTWNQNAEVDAAGRFWVAAGTAAGRGPELTVTGTGTIGTVRVGTGGTFIANGPLVTRVISSGGTVIQQSGVITSLTTSGTCSIEGTDTLPEINVLGGKTTTLNTLASKTITKVYVGPGGEFEYEESLDTIGTLTQIGER